MNLQSTPARTRRRVILAQLLLAALLLAGTATRASVILEPDNLVYGRIVLDGALVTASRGDVAVEARRTLDGPALARYVMGSEGTVGDFYSLAIPLVSSSTPDPLEGAQAGESLFIVVLDATGRRDQQSHSVGERGTVQRIDFGNPTLDVDGNGISDTWETAYFGSAGQDPAAVNPNGRTTLENFLAGDVPDQAHGFFQLFAVTEGGQRRVSFLARATEGPGYQGYTRYYTLETSADLESDSWATVAGFANIQGQNQPVAIELPLDSPDLFYRALIRLVEE